MLIKISFILLFSWVCFSAELPTNYEHYTKGGIKSGLVAEGDKFHLNGKEIQIFAGCMHPFRVHQSRWSQTLLKMKAAGLNAVEFYTAWNLHELTPGQFNFETGTQDLKRFFTLIKENDMFAVFRPGPYICAEWDLGGFPSWLLRDPNMKFRSNYKPYLEAVEKYFSKLFSVVKEFQFSTNGGPIIMIQIENEYQGKLHSDPNRMEYIRALVNNAHKYGMKELLMKGDYSPNKDLVLDDVLETINYGGSDPYKSGTAKNHLNIIKELQPNKPLYVYELYPDSRSDLWKEKQRVTTSVHAFSQLLEETVSLGASFGMYMFIGGTNFGWMAGGYDKPLMASTTSYNRGSPLTESGNYTEKYYKTLEILEKHVKDHNLTQIWRPNPPPMEKAAHYGVVKVTEQISMNEWLKHAQSYKVEKPIHPERLNVGTNYGQLFGFTLYRTTIPKSKTLHFEKGEARDRGNLIVDGKQSSDLIIPKGKGWTIDLDQNAFTKSGNEHTLDILMENMGRYKFGLENQAKGLFEDVLIDGKVHKNWEMIPLEFKQDFLEKVKKDKWSPITDYKEPALYKATLEIKDEPKDTYLKLDDWKTTVIFVNDFNIGKYYDVGPQKTLYVPAPLLKKGTNEILLFETSRPGKHIEFVDYHILNATITP